MFSKWCKKPCAPLSDDAVDAIAAVILICVFAAGVLYFLAGQPT